MDARTSNRILIGVFSAISPVDGDEVHECQGSWHQPGRQVPVNLSGAEVREAGLRKKCW